MNLKTFLENNDPNAFEIIPDLLILNIFVNDVPYALDVDTQNIQAGTILQKTTNFSINENILTVENLSLNIETTHLR